MVLLALLRDVANALVYLAANPAGMAPLIHRDVKPSNVRTGLSWIIYAHTIWGGLSMYAFTGNGGTLNAKRQMPFI